MQVNTKRLKEVLQRATLNYSIDSVRLVFDGERLKSGNRGTNCTALMDIPNDVVPEIKDEVDFNFLSPSQQVKPFLDLVDNDVCDIKISDEKMVLKSGRQKSNVFFCSEHLTDFIDVDAIPRIGEPVFKSIITNDFLDIFKKIKKVASKFQKIYFVVEKGELFIQATDRTNRFANGLEFVLDRISHDDLALRFDFRNFSNLIEIIGNENDDFSIEIMYIPDNEEGYIVVEKNDGSEKYYLVSQIDEG